MTDEKRTSPRKIGTWKALLGGAGFVAAFILAPLFGGVFIIGSIAGFIADGYRLHQDDVLRATGTAATVTVVDVDVRRFTENWGRTRTECVPIVTGTANGKQHTWDLVRHADCGDFFAAGQHVQVRYDPQDLDRVVLTDQNAPDVNRHNLGVDVQILVVGVALSAVGTGFWVWLAGRNKRPTNQP